MDRINDIVGDASFVNRHGRPPSCQDNEDHRVALHLQFVHDQLQQSRNCTPDISIDDGHEKNKDDLVNTDMDIKTMRYKNLNYLQDYINRNKFPQSDDTQLAMKETHTDLRNLNRIPIFRDNQGTYCAVAYMMHQNVLNGDTQIINQQFLQNIINSDANYATVDQSLVKKYPKFKQWIDNCGLSLKEIQTIQPKYEWRRQQQQRQQRLKRICMLVFGVCILLLVIGIIYKLGLIRGVLN